MLNILSEKLGKWFCPILTWQRLEKEEGTEVRTSLPGVFATPTEQPSEAVKRAIADGKLMVGGKEG